VEGVTDCPSQIYKIINAESSEYNTYDAPEYLKSSDNIAVTKSKQIALSAGKGIARILGAGLKSPAFITHDLAQGFHNLPKLYGDTSVRENERIKGIPSGLRAAGKEFAYGLYDGLSGFITQPLRGAQMEGAAGFAKGFARGVGGVVCKPAAGACALPGYAFMGIYKEFQCRFAEAGDAAESSIRAARVKQGKKELAAVTEEERMDILCSWTALGIHTGGRPYGQ
jgi:hypothetical protein